MGWWGNGEMECWGNGCCKMRFRTDTFPTTSFVLVVVLVVDSCKVFEDEDDDEDDER